MCYYYQKVNNKQSDLAAVQIVHNFTTNKYYLVQKTLNKGGFLWVQLQTKKLEVLYMRTVFICHNKKHMILSMAFIW